jgi:putative uncharacterized protein (fragment)
MTEGQNAKKTQIIRKDGKDCLMEVNTQAFSIGKVKLVFAKYDPNKPKGQRTTARIEIYLDFSTALEFSQSILDGRLSKLLVEANKKFEQTKKPWDKNVSISMGGTAHSKNRTDGKAESRTLSAQLGTNKPIALVASSGPGNVNDKGLIVPEKPEHSVFITLSAEDIREVALMIKCNVEAYIQYEHLHKMWAYEPVIQAQQSQQQPQQYNQGQNQNYQQQTQQQQPQYQQQNRGGYQQPQQSQTPQNQQGYNQQYNQQNNYQQQAPQQQQQPQYQQQNFGSQPPFEEEELPF